MRGLGRFVREKRDSATRIGRRSPEGRKRQACLMASLSASATTGTATGFDGLPASGSVLWRISRNRMILLARLYTYRFVLAMNILRIVL